MSAFLLWYLPPLAGGTLGYFFWHRVAGQYEGDRLERSFRFLIGGYYVHLHHWFWSAIALATFAVFELYSGLVYGWLLGSVVQGLKYRDWYYLLYHRDHYSRLYEKFVPEQ